MNYREFLRYETGRPLYAVIGDPIGHSVSPFLHGHVFEKLGIDAEYIAVCVKADELGDFIKAASRKLCGFNVTIPHKTSVIRFLDEVDPKAQEMNSVNTVKIENGRLIGFNTDIDGVCATLSHTKLPLNDGIRATVLGNGGAAKSVVYALKQYQAKITVARRSFSKPCFTDVMTDISVTSFDNLPETDILINSTPVGMTGVSDKSPVDRLPRGCKYVFDVIYTPLETRLLQLAAASGIPGCNGLKMLASQAVKADEIWLSAGIPQEITDGCERLLSAEVARNRLTGMGKSSILLSGFMGCGKSTVGRLAADMLGYEFVDADAEIEKALKMTVSEIFDKLGEDGFRKAESRVLSELSGRGGVLIASGGGAMVNRANFELVAESAMVVYMKSNEAFLFKNISKSDERPLMRKPDPKAVVHELLSARAPHYEANCHISVDAVGTPEEVALRIISSI